MKQKKWFPLVRKSVSTRRNKVIFQKLDFRFPQTDKKSLSKRMVFQLDRMSVSTTFPLDGKTASIDRNIQKNQRKRLSIAVIRVLNRLRKESFE